MRLKNVLEELVVASYKLGLTPCERLQEDLTLSPLVDLRDLMSQVEMFSQLEHDVHPEDRDAGMPPRGEGHFKKRRESSTDHEIRARQRINVVFRKLIYKLLARIRDKSYFKKPNPFEGDPKKHNQWWKCSYQEEKGHRTENCQALKIFLDQLIRDWHLKEVVDQEKDQSRECLGQTEPQVRPKQMIHRKKTFPQELFNKIKKTSGDALRLRPWRIE